MRAAVIVGLLAAGCGKDQEGGFVTRFEDVNMSVSQTRAANAGDVKGLYFGELEIVAYDYRPGEAHQLNPNFGFGTNGAGSTEWSYLSPLLSGHPDARDILLEDNTGIDMGALANGNVMGAPEPGDPFRDNVGAFDIDFLEVYVYRTGMLYDTGGTGNVADYQYFGMNAELNGSDDHPLYRYPAYAGVDDTFTEPIFPVWAAEYTAPEPYQIRQTVNVLFARDDWFPEKRLVKLLEPGTGTGPRFTDVEYDSLDSSVPLDQDQIDVLLSLANEGTQRRFYEFFVIVPMEGPVRVVYEPSVAASAGLDPATAPVELDGNAWGLTVGFDINDLIDETWTNPVSTAATPQIALAVNAPVTAGATYTVTHDGTTYSATVPAESTTEDQVAAELAVALQVELPEATTGLSFYASGASVIATARSLSELFRLGSSDARLTVTETLPAPYVVFAGDSSYVPFGLAVDIGEVSPICPSGAFAATDSCHSVAPGQPRPAGCCVCAAGTVYSPATSGSGTDRECL